VREVSWPSRTILTSIRRRGEVIMPNGDTELLVGDEVTVLTEQARVDQVQELSGGSAEHVVSRETRDEASAEPRPRDPTVASG
jgi:NhaP-type Na+/H+ and K+/H+ antiporter